MTRTPQEIMADHLAAIGAGDMAAILNNFREDATILTAQGALEGLAGVELFFTQAFEMFPNPEFSVTSMTYSGDAVLLRWTASAPTGSINDGVDTFVFADGAIRLETTSFTVEPLSAD